MDPSDNRSKTRVRRRGRPFGAAQRLELQRARDREALAVRRPRRGPATNPALTLAPARADTDPGVLPMACRARLVGLIAGLCLLLAPNHDAAARKSTQTFASVPPRITRVIPRLRSCRTRSFVCGPNTLCGLTPMVRAHDRSRKALRFNL